MSDPVAELFRAVRDGRPGWHADAACREHPELDWFARGERGVRAAEAVCAGCLVRVECATFADVNGERWGVWGGVDRSHTVRSRVA